MDNKEIRFIDSRYNELFRIKDGDSITVTLSDGAKTDRKCTYIDDYHTQIGINTFHICEFAELMERGGSTYRPKDAPSYTLEKIDQSEFPFMYASKDETENRGCICYIRGYFDNSIDERFQSTAMVENRDNYRSLRTTDFQRECDNVINYFRFQADTPVLKSRRDMLNVRSETNATRFDRDNDICGYRVTTNDHTYYFRCDARQGQYNLYLYCYNNELLNRYKDLQFVNEHYADIDKDKFFINENCVMEMYYNPDANAGGQLVELTIYKEDIEEAAKMYKNPKEFFSHLEGISKGALYDVGTGTFKETAEAFINSKADFEGISAKTMEGLKKYAGIEPEKKQKKSEPER
ncbi:MAG: hypothetical protein E7393_03700 [Ruminococcaceae bacterium]|nr:hypothetical protein [Oscillospiraceae bacterium]